MPATRTKRAVSAEERARRAVSRKGLHKLSCWEGCPGSAYVTVSQLERGHVPVCFCGGRLVPDRFDLAPLVLGPEELRQHPEHAAYQAHLFGAVKGQSSCAAGVTRIARRSPEEIALGHVAKARAAAAHAAKVAALHPTVPADLPF